MSNRTSSSLEELLLASDLEITGTQANFTDIVFKFENIKWNDAQRKAAHLLKAGEALNYLQGVRAKIGVQSGSPQPATVPQLSAPVTNPAPPVSSIPMENNRNPETEIFQENYRLLCEFAPELEQELYSLQGDEILSGNSATNIHGSVSIKSIEQDKYGYYLQLMVNEAAKPKQVILLYVNLTEGSVLVLSCEGDSGKFDVYDDYRTRTLINMRESETQNRHLNTLIKQLLSSNLSIPTLGTVTVAKTDTVDQDAERKALEAEKQDLIFKSALADRKREFAESKNERLQEQLRIAMDQKELMEMAFKITQIQNFHLLSTVIPEIPKLYGIASCTITLKSPSAGWENYVIKCWSHEREVHDLVCHVSEINLKTGEKVHVCDFSIYDKNRVMFNYSSAGFLGLEEELIAHREEEVTEESTTGNNVLYYLFTNLIRGKYTATITDRVYSPGREPEVKQTDDVVTDVVVGVGIVGLLVGLVFGVKALNS